MLEIVSQFLLVKMQYFYFCGFVRDLPHIGISWFKESCVVLRICIDLYLYVTFRHNLCVFSTIGVYERNLSVIIQHCVKLNINPIACEMNKESMPCDVKMNIWCKLNPTGDLPEARTGHITLYCETDHKVSRAVEWHVDGNKWPCGNRILRSNTAHIRAYF